MPERIYVGTMPHHRDAMGERTRTRIVNDLGIGTISSVRTAVVYILNDTFTTSELNDLAAGPLCDPVIQEFTTNTSFLTRFDWLVEVGFRPGVTDNVGRTAREAVVLRLRNRVFAPDFSVHTAVQYFFEGNISLNHVTRVARELLANELIQTVSVYTHDQWLSAHTHAFPAPVVVDTAAVVPYREIDLGTPDAELMRLSKDMVLVLSLDEMKTIQSHFADDRLQTPRAKVGLSGKPTNVELEVLAQTWSEHCKHKIFNARITYHEEDRNPQTISSLFKVYIQRATEVVRTLKGENDFCLSVFKDDAGIIRFTDRWNVSFKVETHNSPSALDPYGGALTGIVGVNRDSFAAGLGARLIANTDVFCFASPAYNKRIPVRILHPRRVMEGVREGVEHGGNKSGIPTVNGTIVFDERFLGKPLVFCGTLAIAPSEIAGRTSCVKEVHLTDHILMVGGRIGKDGIHGATFSSEALHEGSPATAVQIGDPITQKRTTDFLLHARDQGLYSGMTDNGAGGLSSSIGEMARFTGGATVHVDRAPLKYHGLEPWEIFLSEAQERFTVAVPPEKVHVFLEMAREWNVDATDLGEFTDSGYLHIMYEGKTVGYLSMEFLHHGLPQMNLTARWRKPEAVIASAPTPPSDTGKDLLNLLKRLNICSKEYVVRQYDHEVQGGSVVKPLCGVRNDGPSDAAVFRPLLDSFEGLVVSNGIVPRYSDLDSYAMAASAFDEAVRNAVCVGADPDHMAALDNFCWCDPIVSHDNPDGEYKLGQLVRSIQALYNMCLNYGVPLISGKDSMKNDYHIGETRISIPPTLLVSVVARINDVRTAVTMDFKTPGNLIYLVGETRRELGMSEYALMKELKENAVPQVNAPQKAFRYYRAIHALIGRACIRACHDLSDGGLGVALAEMCFSGEVGATVDLARIAQSGCLTDADALFSESQSRILLEVPRERAADVEKSLDDLPFACIGEVTRGDRIVIRGLSGAPAVDISRIDAKTAWKSTLNF